MTTWHIYEKINEHKFQQYSYTSKKNMLENLKYTTAQIERVNKFDYVVVAGTMEVA